MALSVKLFSFVLSAQRGFFPFSSSSFSPSFSFFFPPSLFFFFPSFFRLTSYPTPSFVSPKSDRQQGDGGSGGCNGCGLRLQPEWLT